MMNDPFPTSLRRVLLADAAVSGLTGLALWLGSALAAPLLQLPPALLRGAGLSLLPFAAFVAFVATRAQPSRLALWLVIGVNALWVLDSGLLLLGPVAPSALGYAFVIGQALVVALFAELEYRAVRTLRAGARGMRHA